MPSAAGSRAKGMPAAPTVNAIMAATASTTSRPMMTSVAAGRNERAGRTESSAAALIPGNRTTALPA
jgi:hypothetical protein